MTVFLTGASGGIGSIIQEALKKANIEVIAPTSQELNLSKEIDVSVYPEVNGFIHCAGINNLANHTDIKTNELNNLLLVNTISFVELCKKLKLKPNSNIIAIGSLYSLFTKENRIQYTMSKHALYGAVKTLALEKSISNIKVNMISPGFVDTPLTRQNNTEERINYLNENIPLGLTDPWEIANLCLYLIQNNNSITGQNILVDGGYSLKGI
jgi:NAD(P)-dependent dehydrogenase (short-subunit alcohol dehydrogenase family)